MTNKTMTNQNYNCEKCEDTGWVERDALDGEEAQTEQKELCDCRVGQRILENFKEQNDD